MKTLVDASEMGVVSACEGAAVNATLPSPSRVTVVAEIEMDRVTVWTVCLLLIRVTVRHGFVGPVRSRRTTHKLAKFGAPRVTSHQRCVSAPLVRVARAAS